MHWWHWYDNVLSLLHVLDKNISFGEKKVIVELYLWENDVQFSEYLLNAFLWYALNSDLKNNRKLRKISESLLYFYAYCNRKMEHLGAFL